MTPYWEWVRSEAALIGTDGCSAVMGFHVECCFEHDLGFRRGKDPRAAYVLWRDGEPDYWLKAAAITFEEANARFRRCHQNRSKFGRWSPMALWRWLGVKFGSRRTWDVYRSAEAACSTPAGVQ